MKSIRIAVLIVASLSSLVYAADGAAASNPLASFLPLIVIFAIFYFLIIRPQQKKAKEHLQMLNSLKKDDRIITNGGLYATVIAVKGEIVEAKIAENVKVQISKTGVSTILPSETQNQPVTPEIVK